MVDLISRMHADIGLHLAVRRLTLHVWLEQTSWHAFVALDIIPSITPPNIHDFLLQEL